MEAKELRIGNWVFKEVGITALEPIQLKISDITYHYYTSKYKPIPLTEEWLVKFCFNGLAHNGDHLFELIYNDSIGYRFSIEGQYGYPEIKYVHSLQNLYFASTGKELEIG